MAEAQKNTTPVDATAASATPAAAAAPVAASPSARPGALATVAISVGSVLAALALFGGGVAFGSVLPNQFGHPNAHAQEAGPGPIGQDRMGQGGQVQGQPRPGQGEHQVHPGQLPPGMMGGEGPMHGQDGDTPQDPGQEQSGK
jgi:hypothetical protein